MTLNETIRMTAQKMALKQMAGKSYFLDSAAWGIAYAYSHDQVRVLEKMEEEFNKAING